MMLTDEEVMGRVAGVTRVRLEQWVSRGWVKPVQGEDGLLYSEIDISRCHLICDLVDDVAIGEDALPVVLGLLDQIYGLRRELKAFVEAVESQPEGVKAAIVETLVRQHPQVG